MRWRCAACGKPHERNDPPCDNCGHHDIERAVVPQAPAGDGTNDTIWVCADCGRTHQRNSPPCSRCGGMQFEQRSSDYIDVDESELGGTGWVDVIGPRQAVLGLAAVLLAGVLVAGAVGVVDLPGVGPPTVSDVPGESESAGGLVLADVESAYVDGLNAYRAENDRASVTRDDTLQEMATYYNQRRVKAIHGDGEMPGDDALNRFDYRCDRPLRLTVLSLDVQGSLAEYDSESDLAGAILRRYTTETGGAGSAGEVGVDVHVGPDGTVYVTQILC